MVAMPSEGLPKNLLRRERARRHHALVVPPDPRRDDAAWELLGRALSRTGRREPGSTDAPSSGAARTP
jgi:hypothetical protein